MALLGKRDAESNESLSLRWGERAAKLLVVGAMNELFNEQGEPFGGMLGSLLLSSIEKGLKVQRIEVALLGVSRSAKREQISEELRNFTPRVVLALGREIWELCDPDSSDGSTILTCSLREVSTSVGFKRQYWEDLKKIISIFNEA